MQFYETKIGNQFFTQQLPHLITALQKIAVALEQHGPALHLPSQVSLDYLKDLYYGNLEPDQYVYNEAIRRYTKEIIDLQSSLHQRLAPEDLELMETLEQTLDRRSCEEAETAFEVGFQTAMQWWLPDCPYLRRHQRREKMLNDKEKSM